MTILEQDRARRQLEKHRSSQEQSGTLKDNTAPIQLLVEIVSINGILRNMLHCPCPSKWEVKYFIAHIMSIAIKAASFSHSTMGASNYFRPAE
jgi:hypothetical protein|mmetsp:Transcript_19678/g.35719  ORF Transcript_19678/g.35719 Transcript_19678/m.35719 type:complete len:93 (+) Transcript_19678:417-695(+)